MKESTTTRRENRISKILRIENRDGGTIEAIEGMPNEYRRNTEGAAENGRIGDFNCSEKELQI